MKADGSDPAKLTWPSNLDERRPSWSPEGTKIALMSRIDTNGGEYAIWIMTIDSATRDASDRLGCGIAIQSIGSQAPQPFAPANRKPDLVA